MMKKFAVVLFLMPLPAFAACSGASPSWTAASASVSDISACLSLVSSGDTVHVPAGSATWTTTLTSFPSNLAVTLAGATNCTGSGDPNGSTSGIITCTDNTNITVNVDQAIQFTGSPTALVRVTGFTFIGGISSTHGNIISASGSLTGPGFRIDHNHFIMPVSDSVNVAVGNYGLIDHNYFQDTVSSGGAAVPLNLNGNYADFGYSNWNQATGLGTNLAAIVEQNYYTTSSSSTEGFFDGYFGSKIVVRFNTISGNMIGGYHGTDSGAPYRSGVFGEYYGNNIANPVAYALTNPRGGVTMLWGNSLPADGGGNGVPLLYYRYGAQITPATPWGEAGPGLNWITYSATASSWSSAPVTLNASAYQMSHTYSAQAVVVDTNGCNLQTVAGGTTGGSQPSCPSTFGGTVTDTGGVVWTYVGGSTTASSLSYGWCAANPDTACSANATCSALSSGDACSRYLDANGGAYPYRDQPCVGHNQSVVGCYEWLNSGSGAPSQIFATSSSTSSIIMQNRDYYDYVPSGFTGATGVGAGTLASAPPTCTQGVGYFATDQGSWNQSGNGFGNGVLYQCGANNNFTPYYTPYTYPDPLEGSTVQLAPAAPANLQGTGKGVQ
ncbi:MAG: hypothetical protein WCF30_11010 [Terracidiphilus sp.]